MSEDDKATTPKGAGELFPVPEPTQSSGRYAVYDRVLGQYVGGVSSDKPTAADAKRLGGDHSTVVVEV